MLKSLTARLFDEQASFPAYLWLTYQAYLTLPYQAYCMLLRQAFIYSDVAQPYLTLGRHTAACLSALLWLPSPLICGLMNRLTACFLGWPIAAYLPALLWLTGLVICGLSARLIMAHLPGSLLLTAGLLPLTGLVICGLLARLIVTH
jgi:hypothetical protein